MVSQETDGEQIQKAQADDINNSGGVGALLQASRLRVGNDLREVANTLHIRFIYLDAIEDGRYDDLPGRAYAVGFIRSYSEYLGLDSEEVVRRFKQETSIEHATTKLQFPVPIPESSVPGGAIIFVGFAVAAIAYGIWYVGTSSDGVIAELVAPVPERLSVLAPKEDKAPVEQQKETPEPEIAEQPVAEVMEATVQLTPEEQDLADELLEAMAEELLEEDGAEKLEEIARSVQKLPPEPVADVPEQVQDIGNEQPGSGVLAAETVIESTPEVVESPVESVVIQPVQPTAESQEEQQQVAAVLEPAPQPEQVTKVPDVPETEVAAVVPAASSPVVLSGRVYGIENTNSRILVKAMKNSWIQVRDEIANQLVMTRLLRAGDSYRVPNQPGLKLLTGNAGALVIVVDGQTVPPIGGAGTVRRSVLLEPERLLEGQAVD